MILFRVQMRVPPAVRDRVVKSLLRLVGPTRAIKGCRASNALTDVEDADTIIYMEEWETQGQLDERLRTDSMMVLLSVMDLASEPPDVRFDTISEMRGMEIITAARMGNAPGSDGPGS